MIRPEIHVIQPFKSFEKYTLLFYSKNYYYTNKRLIAKGDEPNTISVDISTL